MPIPSQRLFFHLHSPTNKWVGPSARGRVVVGPMRRLLPAPRRQPQLLGLQLHCEKGIPLTSDLLPHLKCQHPRHIF